MTSNNLRLPRYEGVPVAPMAPRRRPAAFTLDFSGALAALRSGRQVARAGWDGACLEITATASSSPDAAPRLVLDGRHGAVRADWLASSDDLLAKDWGVLAG